MKEISEVYRVTSRSWGFDINNGSGLLGFSTLKSTSREAVEREWQKYRDRGYTVMVQGSTSANVAQFGRDLSAILRSGRSRRRR